MIPERYAPMTYALFRIVFGFLFLCYRTAEDVRLFGGQVPPLASLQGAAGVIETVCGLLVMLGLFTRLAAFLASGEMAVAFWYIHVIDDRHGQGSGHARRPHADQQRRRRCGRVLFCVPLHLLREAQASGVSTA